MHTNHDPKEIEKFSKLADDWWNLEGQSKPLHQINPLRLHYIEQQLQKNSLPFSKLHGLDVGCGGGILTESLATLGINMIGLDLSAEALLVAKRHAAENYLHIEYLQQSVECLTKTHAASFDVITCMEMLEHVPDPFSIIQACQQLLKPNGLLFLSTINRNLKSKMMMIYGAEHLARLVPKGTHDYERFIRPSELIKMTERAHLTVKEMIGMEYKLFTRSFMLSDNVDVNYILMAQKQS